MLTIELANLNAALNRLFVEKNFQIGKFYNIRQHYGGSDVILPAYKKRIVAVFRLPSFNSLFGPNSTWLD